MYFVDPIFSRIVIVKGTLPLDQWSSTFGIRRFANIIYICNPYTSMLSNIIDFCDPKVAQLFGLRSK